MPVRYPDQMADCLDPRSSWGTINTVEPRILLHRSPTTEGPNSPTSVFFIHRRFTQAFSRLDSTRYTVPVRIPTGTGMTSQANMSPQVLRRKLHALHPGPGRRGGRNANMYQVFANNLAIFNLAISVFCCLHIYIYIFVELWEIF
jgi:hypothetical protein